MLNRRCALTILLVGLLLAGCGQAAPTPTAAANPTFELDQIVHATVAALTAQATPLPAATPLPPTPTVSTAPGSISGSLTYPADSLPAMYVVAYQVGTETYQYIITLPGRGTYEIDGLPPGTYHIIAYTVGGAGFPGGLAGGYTKAVPCGLAMECADHSLIDVTVAPGQHATGINPGDWYAPSGTFPPFPAAPTLTAEAPTSTATLPAALSTPTP